MASIQNHTWNDSLAAVAQPGVARAAQIMKFPCDPTTGTDSQSTSAKK